MKGRPILRTSSEGRRAQRWVGGHRVALLENGDEFYPRVFEAIRNARREVLVETFILQDDKVGRALQEALREAARRGAHVALTVDGFGSPNLPRAFIETMTADGVAVRAFDPGPSILGQQLHLLRRMHRKLVAIDGTLAFVGGINFCADQLLDYGPSAKQDYTVEVEGPIVAEIRRFMHRAIARGDRRSRRRRERADQPPELEAPAAAGEAELRFLTRDNHQHTGDIERHYRAAIRSARSSVIIANAYFFPGWRLIREMREAAVRGVDVRLILQGEPDMLFVQIAARTLYHYLLRAGVKVYEYCERPLHGKIAVIDEAWSTVGSSNLDPLSLALNLEANVAIRDRAFNHALHEHLLRISEGCRRIHPGALPRWARWKLVRSVVVYHLLRWSPLVARWLPHRPQAMSRL